MISFSHYQSQNNEECNSFDENLRNFNEIGMHFESKDTMIDLISKDGNYQQNFEVPNMFEDLRNFNANSFDNLAFSQSQNQNNVFSQNYQNPSSDTPIMFNATSIEGQLPPSNSSVFNSQQQSSEYDLNCFQMPTTTRGEIINPYKKSHNSDYFMEKNKLPMNPGLENNGNELQESFESNVQTSTSSGIANFYQNSNDHQDFIMKDASCSSIQNDVNSFGVSKTNDDGNKLNDVFEDAFL